MTNFSLNMDSLQVGQLPNTNIRMIDSYIAQEDIDFGKPVILDLSDNTVKNWVAGTAADLAKLYMGISVFTQSAPNLSFEDNTGNKILAGTVGNFIRFGDQTVITEVAATKGEHCYINVANGAFTNVEANNLKIGRFMTSTTAGGEKAVIFVNNY